MPVSRIKVKNRHLKKKAKKPTGFLLNQRPNLLALFSLQELWRPLMSFCSNKQAQWFRLQPIRQKSFIESIAASAKPVADSNGLYPSVMIAQAILESNWGSSQLSRAPYYNLFGIQGTYQGKSVVFKTQGISQW